MAQLSLSQFQTGVGRMLYDYFWKYRKENRWCLFFEQKTSAVFLFSQF
jgi:hypothetical protein